MISLLLKLALGMFSVVYSTSGLGNSKGPAKGVRVQAVLRGPKNNPDDNGH